MPEINTKVRKSITKRIAFLSKFENAKEDA
jgi:hypothetical protein